MWPSRNEEGRTSRLRRTRSVRLAALACGVVSLCVSCGFMDLREVSVETEPAEAGAVLSARDTPVRVRFGTEVDKLEAERAFAVVGETGNVEGDLRWKGSAFTFVPMQGWESGVRYRLTLSGSISASDGREARPDIDLPFTAVRAEGAPVVTEAFPADGASTGTRAEEGALVVLGFSEAMEKRSVEDAFSLEPAADLDFTWNEACTVLTATPRSSLSPCIAYRWSLGTGARSADGAPLAQATSGRFATDGDRVPPRVVRTYPALLSAGTWVDTGASLAELLSGQAVVVEFSEPMEADSIRGAVRIEPSFAGRTDAPTPTTVVFVPDRSPEYGIPLLLVVSADAADRAGLTLGTDYREPFVPSIQPLSILSIVAGGGETAMPPFASTTPGGGTALQVALAAPDGLLTLAIRFSASFYPASRAAATELVSLSAFFPGSPASPGLRSASWPSTDTVSLTWEGLEDSAANAPCLYLLSIDGGRGGLSNGAGLALADDVKVLLETKP